MSDVKCAACGRPGHRYGRNEGIDRFDPQACINGLLSELERWDGFPSDEDVGAAIPAFYDVPADHHSIESIHRARVRAALESVLVVRIEGEETE